jgi:pimeloyl-ACP methyl ester carboxylesterase
MSPEILFVECPDPSGSHRLAYARWDGPADGPVQILVHGLTRNGRDFDRLAERLSGRGPVYAPDMPGRGRSAWLADATHYNYPQYIADVAALIDHIGAQQVDYVGTSMGGIIGMFLAAAPGSRIRRLVLNDIGPFIPKAAQQRIAAYAGADPRFATLDELAAYLRRIMSTFGPIGAEDWQHLLAHAHRRTEEGAYAMHYDPAIGTAFKGDLNDVDLWSVYEQVRCPVVLIHGLQSDLVSAELVAAMRERGPRAETFGVAEAGHAPALLREAEITVITEFFNEG